MPRIDRWRKFKEYSEEPTAVEPGDLVRRKYVTGTESIHTPKIGIILSVAETDGSSWLKMATVAWSGTTEIEDVATIYLQRILHKEDEEY